MITLGLLQLSVWLYRWFTLVWRTLLGARCTTARYGVDSWAIVTGCSDSIGRASARYLARQGFNLVLIGATKKDVDSAEIDVIDAAKTVEKKV